MDIKKLTTEKTTLDANIKELQRYLEENNISGAAYPMLGMEQDKPTIEISQHERADLQQQFTVMKQYAEILQRRINRL